MNQLFFFLKTAIIILLNTCQVLAQISLRYEINETLTYEEVISAYKYLDQTYKNARLLEVGKTDIGKPLHLFIITKNGDFDSESNREKDKCVIFINNGIHPGEPPGVDASIKFSEDILSDREGLNKHLDNTVICIIPMYSVGGSLNRSPFNRSNQETPPEAGFRGNGKNLDLNRDFIKMDSRNAKSLVSVFHTWKPHIFLDTHVTNGSDHQYVITLIPTISQRLPKPMNNYFRNEMVPALFQKMKESPYEMIPYVNWINRDPSNGITSYFDAPRVSTGFASLFNTYSFMTENHVYKNFGDQVKSVYYFLCAVTEFANCNSQEIIKTKKQADILTAGNNIFISRWEVDTSRQEKLLFKGYEGNMQISRLTGLKSFYYDRNLPYSREVPFYQHFKPSDTIIKPEMYIIPQAWEETILRLNINGVEMKKLKCDTKIEVEVYYITDVKFSPRPNNGHFRNTGIKTRSEFQKIQFYKGDYVIEMNQPANRFIMEVLEPTSVDSYLSWNFFDPVFDKREYFSPTGFEKKALQYLEEHPELKKEFEEKKTNDTDFANNHYAQINFIYTHSPYFEKSYRRYPVYRINQAVDLPIE